MKTSTCLAAVISLVLLCSSIASTNANAGRLVVSLDGIWEIDESVSDTAMPKKFGHEVQVPGMVNLAQPAFADVDQFDSMELIANRVRKKALPESARVHTAGVPRQNRNYFWYRKTFRTPEKRAVAILKINKAQFGTAVWLNGTHIGDYPGCFSAGYFNLTDAIDWEKDNTLVVRIGAHPAVLPDAYPAGTDFEKLKWTPGIYDRVSVIFCDNPVIESVQVAPRVSTSEIVVQTKIKNYGPDCAAELRHRVKTWKGNNRVAAAEPIKVALESGSEKVFTQTIRIPKARLWSPEDPFLYQLESSTGGDTLATRFGMREFRSDAATKRFYLNGKVYYLRGSNITLHRFFEDPNCGALPWTDNWLQKLLVEIPKKMHWNSFRFCIGPAPERWLEIADETGLLIQNEFFIWTGAPSWDGSYSRKYDVPELLRQYKDWMRDNWNHPSVAIWDANNETLEPIFGEKIIPEVRPLDLSNRPWENSYNPPVAPDDPVEHHPYLFYSSAMGDAIKFRITDLETLDPTPKGGHVPKQPHPILINEYGWLWLNRDGSPTLLTEKLYPRLLGPNSTAQERFALNAYLLAGLTEFWRASRQYAGVLHFVYLTCSYPGVYTSDHFLDIETLKLEPHFADYMSQAFKPLGVYINFFQPTLQAGASGQFTVKLINDYPHQIKGKLRLALETNNGKQLARAEQSFVLPGLGAASLQMALEIPETTGKCILKATAKPDDKIEPTVSRRWVTLEKGPK